MAKYTEYRKAQEIAAKQEAFEKDYQSRYALALQNLLKQEEFRFFIADILGYAKTFSGVFDEKGNVASYNSGRQSVGLKIFNDILSVSPNSFIQIQKEEQERTKRKENMLGGK